MIVGLRETPVELFDGLTLEIVGRIKLGPALVVKLAATGDPIVFPARS